MITVQDTSSWYYGKANIAGSSGLVGQVTKCEYEGVIFFVRENTNNIPSFLISSSVRYGDKAGSKPSKARQCLELAAPEHNWEAIAEIIRQTDPMKRPVNRNKSFNLKTAPQYFK